MKKILRLRKENQTKENQIKEITINKDNLEISKIN